LRKELLVSLFTSTVRLIAEDITEAIADLNRLAGEIERPLDPS
jgi:hypothetical protein